EVGRDLDIPLINFSVFTAATRVFFGPQKPGPCTAREERTESVPSPAREGRTVSSHELLTTTPQPGPGQGMPVSLHELLTTPPRWVDFPSSIAYRKSDAVQMVVTPCKSTLLLGPADRSLDDACRIVAIHSCIEVEGDYLEAHKRIFYGKPVIPIGLLPPEQLPVDQERSTLVGQPDWQNIANWLDRQKPRSVVFVGFGSECKLNKDQLYEIANGVQLSGLPFLWILQKPNWASNDEVIDVFLPSGFRDAITEGRGLLHVGWAPQKEILAHSSILGSLFHAGWGSTIETLQHGHVLVLLPFIFDQGLNARLLVEKGVAIEVKRNKEDGWFRGNDIAMSLREAMVSDEGEELRTRTRNVAAIFRDRKLHDSY
ncbi:hypothetical protein HAX54_021678, partial [Datura stramonium]|nr:hypothetical protein [Datura stramonium]